MANVLTWLAVGFQFLAAILWLGSTLAKVDAKKALAEYQKEHGTTGGPMQIIDDSDGSDVLATAALQVKWNRWGALAASLGLALQAAATWFTSLA